MLNKYILGSALAAAIIFSGCSSKAPAVDTTAQKTETAAPSASSSSSTSTAPVATVDAVAEAQSKIQTVLFDFDKFNIRADMQPIVEGNAKLSGSVDAKVKLEGNADERGTDEYNYALGLKRANTVKAAYASKGVAEAKMSTVTFGEGNPVCKESTEECWAKNRRVDTKLEK
jgi:peptidoglycan-associated lipoprotein